MLLQTKFKDKKGTRVYIRKGKALCASQTFSSFISGFPRLVYVALGSNNLFSSRLPFLKNTLVDLVDSRRVCVSVMPFRRCRFVVPHPPFDALHLSLIKPNITHTLHPGGSKQVQ